jgi:hypothetical protein
VLSQEELTGNQIHVFWIAAANPAAAVAAALKSAKISLLLVIYTGSYFRVFQIASRISSSLVNRWFAAFLLLANFRPKFDLKNLISTYLLYKGIFMEKMAQIRQISKNFFFKSPGFFFFNDIKF